MTARRAIGSYAVGATDAEKVTALRLCLSEAAMELAELSATWGEVEDALADAETDAETVFYERAR